MKNKIINKIVVWSVILSLTFEATPVWALAKEETVYGKLNSNGSVNSVTVSEHLSDNGNNKINDKTSLTDINNISGNGSYSKDGDKIVWETNGEDIYYQGKTDKELPISMNIKYYLDDKEMSVNDMLGKAGKVRIVIDYKNNLENKVLINGKMETLYTPFVVASTSLLSNSNNKNIKVSNGKVIDNGNNSLIITIATPGLYDSLKVNELKNMDKIEISYDTKDFELNSIYTVATSKLLDDSDLNVFDTINDLYSSIDLLQDNMNLLVDSAGKLNDGASKIADGNKALSDGISKIANVYEGYRSEDNKKIKEELISLIEKNIKVIIPALEKDVTEEATNVIKENKSKLEEGVVEYSIKNTKYIINSELDRIIASIDINGLLRDIINEDLKNQIINDQSIQSIITIFNDELNKELETEITKTTKATIGSLENTLQNNMTDEEKMAYVQNIATKYNISIEQAAGIVSEVQNDTINGIKNGINNSSDQISKNVSTSVISTINNKDFINGFVNNYISNVNNRLIEILGNNENVKAYEQQLINNIASKIKAELTKEELIKKYAYLSNYADTLVNTIIDKTASDLASIYTEEYTIEIVNRVISKQFSKDNINTELNKVLKEHENEIEEKLKIIDTNVATLKNSSLLISNGANELATGMRAFSEGINKYNTEGIQKISGFVNGDIKDLQKRVQALVDLSNSYKTVDDIDPNSTGESRLVFIIDAVKKEKKKQYNSEKIVEKKTFGEKIKGLFK